MVSFTLANGRIEPVAVQETRRRFVTGLDLGQANDYTALAVGEVMLGESTWSQAFNHLERFPLRTPYPEMVDRVADRMAQLRQLGDVLLVIDHTGVGRPVVDLFRMAGMRATMWPVTIASSTMAEARRDPESLNWTVPKKDLVGALQSLAYGGRLSIARDLKEAKTLTKELEQFRMKYTASANVTYEAWRERDHDDLVLAVAMSCWAAHRWFRPGGLI